MANIDLIKSHIKEFELYCSLLQEWNEKFNLTAITDKPSVFSRHFLDSIAAADYITQNASVCDIGSGAGFPGIPLKIVRPDIKLTLTDSVNKKVTFMQEVITRLNLKDASALHIRAEDAAAPDNYRESFDVTLSRAVAPLNTLSEYAMPLIKTGGIFIAYKTAASVKEETAASLNALKQLNGKIIKTTPYTLDTGAFMDLQSNNDKPETALNTAAYETMQLSLIIIEKTAPCPLRYPRGGNKPRLMPL